MTKLSDTADNLQLAYLEYVNDYLTVECFAAQNAITLDEAQAIIDAGRIIHEKRVEAYKLP